MVHLGGREMSGRPTPETDTETMRDEYDHVDTDLGPFAPSDTVPADFARKLERERDEAREDATNYYAKIGELEQERDEARDALAAAKYYLTKERDDALSQIVQAECRAERFCQERDEARIAIIATLEENRHLADVDDCTLAKLKSVVPEWK